MEGQYDYMGRPCFACDGTGKYGSDKCPVCIDGHYSPPEEQVIFEAITMEEAIQEYNKWVKNSGMFVEYGYSFEGLGPNATTVAAMEETNLPVFDTAEEMLDELHEDLNRAQPILDDQEMAAFRAALDRKLCTERDHQKYFLNDALHGRNIDDPETPGGGGCIYCIGFRLASENEKLLEIITELRKKLNEKDS